MAAEVVLLIWCMAYQDLVLSDLNPGLVMELSKMGLSSISVFPDGDLLDAKDTETCMVLNQRRGFLGMNSTVFCDFYQRMDSRQEDSAALP